MRACERPRADGCGLSHAVGSLLLPLQPAPFLFDRRVNLVLSLSLTARNT